MEEKEFMKRVASSEMPDISAVREECLDQLRQEKRNQKMGGGHKVRGLGVGMVAAVIILLCVIPGSFLFGKGGRMNTSFQEEKVAFDVAQENSAEASDSGAVQENRMEESENEETSESIAKGSNSDEISKGGNASSKHWKVEGGSISLEHGETIRISAKGKEKYEDVYIALLGTDVTEIVGKLEGENAYSFTAEQTGEYVIYAGNENISEEIMIEHEISGKKTPLLFLKKSSYKEYAKKNVTMELVSVSKKKIKIKFTNTGTERFQYSKIFTLKKWENGKWKKVPFGRKAMFPKCVFPLDPGSSQMESITWKKFFDKDLPKGKYKIQWAYNSLTFGL